MRGSRRTVTAVVLTALATIGVAERAAMHAHPLEENDLVPHQLMIVDRGTAAGAGTHLAAARLGDHPVCVECSLAASAVAVGPSAASGVAAATPDQSPRRSPRPLFETRWERSAPARAPPSA